MSIDSATAAAIGQNLSGIGEAASQFFDPTLRAKAAMMNNQNTLLSAKTDLERTKNSWLPRTSQAEIDAHSASANENNSHAENWNQRNKGLAALNAAYQPVTSFSQGAAVGGRDEMQDPNTNNGDTATGHNLSKGVVAINKKGPYKIGDIVKIGDGIYTAADYNGNKNPSILDIYRPGNEYQGQSGNAPVTVLGHEPIKYGTTADQLAATRARYERMAALSNVANGGGSNDLMQGFARASAMGAGTEEDARRAGLAITGNGFSAGENFMPARSDAYQKNELASKEAISDADNLSREAIAGATLIAKDGSTIGKAGTSTAAQQMNASSMKDINGSILERFSTLDGKGVAQADLGKSQAWASSVSTLVDQGVPYEAAKYIADTHHGISNIQKNSGFPVLGSASNDYSKTNSTPITPEQASIAASHYAHAVSGRGDGPSPQVQAGIQYLNAGRQGGAPTTGPFNYAPGTGQSVSTAPVTANTPVPQTGLNGKYAGPMAAPATDPARVQTLGKQMTESQNLKNRDTGTAYNTDTLKNVVRLASQNNIPIEQVIASVMEGGDPNKNALESALSNRLGGTEPYGEGVGMSETSPSIFDMKNAFTDARALQAMGIDPATVMRYRQQAGGAIPQAAQAVGEHPELAARLQKYQ